MNTSGEKEFDFEVLKGKILGVNGVEDTLCGAVVALCEIGKLLQGLRRDVGYLETSVEDIRLHR